MWWTLTATLEWLRWCRYTFVIFSFSIVLKSYGAAVVFVAWRWIGLKSLLDRHGAVYWALPSWKHRNTAKSPPGLVLPRDVWNAADRSPALRPSLQRWVWHGQKAVMLEILDSSATTGNLCLQISTPGLKLLSIRNLLSKSKPQATRDQMDVWCRVFTAVTHFFIDVYVQENIVWEHRDVCQF